jgi:uncharacterized membrane protein YeaQ/YmgE (transglycosylase-associated protein family)
MAWLEVRVLSAPLRSPYKLRFPGVVQIAPNWVRAAERNGAANDCIRCRELARVAPICPHHLAEGARLGGAVWNYPQPVRIGSCFNDLGANVMHLSNESLLVIIFVGIVAGWLAGRVMEGGGFGLIGDLIVGLIGAFIGDWLLPQLGVHFGAGIVALIINAFIGAVILLLILRLIGGGWGYRRRW